MVINITLADSDAKSVVSALESLSDRLTKQHADSHSGTEQFVLISAIQEVDRLAVNIREQIEYLTVSHTPTSV